MPLLVLRFVFMMVALGLGASLAPRFGDNKWLVFFGVILSAVVVLIGDVLIRRKQLDVASAIYFGTIVGALLSYVVGLALYPLLPADQTVRDAIQLVTAMLLIYLCTSLLLQTRDDFRFLIPYVEFVKEVKGLSPYVIDTSAIMDGRIADVVAAGVLDHQLVVPQFVLSELKRIADSSDRAKKGRGRRGLNILEELRHNSDVDLQLYDRELPEFEGESVDQKLVLLAQHLGGKIITNDFNLNRVARLNDVSVINLNDLANALKPAYVPGDEFRVKILKPGDAPGQGVGYLDDGTMVVVEGASDRVQQTIPVTVTSTLQKSAGRMIFAKLGEDSKTKPEETVSK